MGGAGYIFTGENANVMHNSMKININLAEQCVKHEVARIFLFFFCACIKYPEYNQRDPDNPLF